MTATEPEYDVWEREIQTAYDAHQAGLCPGCGQPLAECIADDTRENQPIYEASYYQCLSCETLEGAANVVAAADRRQAEKDDKAGRPPRPTRHRRWFVRRIDSKSDPTEQHQNLRG